MMLISFLYRYSAETLHLIAIRTGKNYLSVVFCGFQFAPFHGVRVALGLFGRGMEVASRRHDG
jgi:hypothetical protein